MVGSVSGRSRWKSMTAAEREQAYSPSSCLPDGDYRPFIEAYCSQSDAAWKAVNADPEVDVEVVSYGVLPTNTVDVVVPRSSGSPVPLVVFIHGGYWQELSKTESRFAAADCVAHGWAFAAVDYSLAPERRLDEIVEECRQAVRTVAAAAHELGIDPARITVSGSSAGAHLAAMVALDPYPEAAHLHSTVLVSGIYELEPLCSTSINDALGLTPAVAREQSPLFGDLAGFPSTLIAVGENETDEFKAQSQAFADALAQVGSHRKTLEIPGTNHFDVILDLARASTMLGEAVAELVSDHDR